MAVHGALEPNSHFWHLNSLKIKTQIVHFVALDELYKTMYLDWQNRHIIDVDGRKIGRPSDPPESTRIYQVKLPVRPSEKI
jgi:hypothetical protein